MKWHEIDDVTDVMQFPTGVVLRTYCIFEGDDEDPGRRPAVAMTFVPDVELKVDPDGTVSFDRR